MVIEDIKARWVEKRPYIAFFFGFVYVFIGYGLAGIFFKNSISVAMLFLSTLLIVPTLIKLLKYEERAESREGSRHFFRNHKEVFETYLFLFIGTFAGYIALGQIFSLQFEGIFQFQLNFLKSQEGLSSELINNFLNNGFTPSMQHVLGLLNNNLAIAVICFLLSLFYGAGAIFLLMLNASIFSAFIVFVMDQLSTRLSESFAVISFFLLHLVPETAGFLMAAIAGGVMSKALITEKFGSRGFRNVAKDSALLLLIACVFIILAAFIEVYVTAGLFNRFF